MGRKIIGYRLGTTHVENRRETMRCDERSHACSVGVSRRLSPVSKAQRHYFTSHQPARW
jgi:hypothetical protein